MKYLINNTSHTVGIFFSSPPLKENVLKKGYTDRGNNGRDFNYGLL